MTSNTPRRLLGFIPARSGSKRLPGKNTLPIGGFSLIERTVKSALKCPDLEEIGFSSDSDHYIQMARAAGLAVDYKRPETLNRPETTTAEIVLHYLDWRRTRTDTEITHVLVLQPTSPFRDEHKISLAISRWRESGKDSLVSATPAGPDNGYVLFHDRATGKLTSGSTHPADGIYQLDGELFLASVDMIESSATFWNADSELFVNSHPRPYDIDTADDFFAARAMIEAGWFSK